MRLGEVVTPGGDVTDQAAPAGLVRRCAVRLAALDRGLPAQAELVLAEATPGKRGRFDIPTATSLAGLLVSVASSGWAIWRDIKRDREAHQERSKGSGLIQPARDLLIGRLREDVARTTSVAQEKRDKLIEAVVDELLSSEVVDD